MSIFLTPHRLNDSFLMKKCVSCCPYSQQFGSFKSSKAAPESFKCWSQVLGSSVLSVFGKEFANVYIAHELGSQHFPEKSAALNASHETLRAGQGLPQEKVPDGYVRISPSLSCNTEFPSIMFLSVLLVCPVENAWKCGTNAFVFPRPWSMEVFEQADWSVMLRLQLTWCWWTNGFIVWCFGTSSPQCEALSVIFIRAG